MPGMTIPLDLDCKIAVRTKSKSLNLRSEYPDHTEIEKIITNGSHYIFTIRFKKLGENVLIKKK